MTPRVSGPNWYDVLDVDQSASTDEIRSAWRAAIADLTPADRRFRLYNQAAEVLLDRDRRAAHDTELAAAADEEQEPEVAPAERSGAERPAAEPSETREPSGGAPGRAPWQSRLPAVPTWLVLGVALLTVAAVAVTAYLWSQPSAAAVAEAASSARSAAERAVVPVLSYDHQTLEQDQEEAHEWLTSDYRKDYDELFAVIEENAPSTRTVVDVDVVASAVSRVNEDGDRVEVLLFVDRPTTNRVNKQPVVYKDQVTVTMQREGEEWLVDDLRTSPAAQ